ncbi:methylmalonyl-CoA mutase family protein [Streptomyces marincola]|uniref:Methylmalonyl-CoA mutase n=1 Tax=Streptomyces marincola TaxID=2878388 RepID=A0A1W7CSI4_9ACTN|nr:methylmalonyl-CoA mutase family protein [Streptomyces marincola]ARQ67773.1 methylmalonyl-CoA mutase [Streptomyces marincola]
MTGMSDEELLLAAEFPAVTREQWQDLVAGVLRKAGRGDLAGPDAERKLATRLGDGIVTRPLYTAEDGGAEAAYPGYPGFAPFVRGGRAQGTAVTGWDVRPWHNDPDPARANEAALTDLENGATSLWLALGAAGLPVNGMEKALAGVHLDLAPVVLDAGPETGPAARELLRLLADRGVAPDDALGHLGADPLAVVARTGDATGLAEASAEAAGLAALCHREYPKLTAVGVDALPYHEAGGSAAQELGCSLATAVAYLHDLTEAGLPLDAAARQLEFRYAATADQFLTIAKFRAARRLWARVAEVCGVAPHARAQRQHAVTSPVMMTRRDPWVNMLRTTVACLAAGTGGADAVTVLPFDHELGLPDAFSRRIARNTSTVLMAESHLARVIDPAGGSWYVEELTADLAEAGWAFFQELMGAGGQAEALASGLVGERLAATWRERSARLAARREPVTGVSEFPSLVEREVRRAAAPAPLSGGLPRVRRDEAFEALRARSDAHLAATGARPRVLLAALGTPAAHTARATFAANLFQAAGIEPVHEPESVDEDSAGAALRAAGTGVACLCSSDAMYAERAAGVAAALKEAGARRVFLAGRPGEHGDAWERAGVDDYVFVGCDAVAVLSSVLDLMGVA